MSRSPHLRVRNALGLCLAVSLVAAGVVALSHRMHDSSSADVATTTLALTTTTTSVVTSTTQPRTHLGSGQSVTIAFGGDVHFEGSLASALERDPKSVFSEIAPELSSADVAMVNLETALGTRGVAEPKAYNFQAPRTSLDALASAGVDVATMANNHGVDFGAEGLQETLEIKANSPISLIGIGLNDTEAYAPFTTTIHEQVISFIAATDVLDASLVKPWTATATQGGVASVKEIDRLIHAVNEARATSDTVVVYLHWGQEGQSCPTRRQKDVAQVLVDAGADIVVGSHTHRVVGAGTLDRSGSENFGPAYVAYGLGNFAFYTSGGPGATTGVLKVSATGRRIDGASWIPAKITSGAPVPLEGNAKDQAEASWSRLKACTGLS